MAQYYNLVRLSFDGCRRVQSYARGVATALSARIAELGPFELLTKGDELPIFAVTLRDHIENFTVFDASNALRERGWPVPAYTFPRTGRTSRRCRGSQAQPAPVHDNTSGAGFHH